MGWNGHSTPDFGVESFNMGWNNQENRMETNDYFHDFNHCAKTLIAHPLNTPAQ